jgi:hypothetical protein
MITQERPTTIARWPICRVIVGHSTTVQLLSSDFVRLVTHFHRTTFLCPEVEECDACKLLPGRAYWYLPVVVLPYSKHAILELSAHACSDLEQKCRFAGSALRPGVQVELSRRSAKKPIRIEFNCQAENPPAARLEEWVSPLMAIYGLPALKPGECLESYGARVKENALARANLRAAAYKLAAGQGAKGR